MSEIKHTHGPWFVVDNGVFLEIRTSPEGYGGEQIGDVCSSKYIEGHEDNPVALPNAYLIAAAPDMLDALKIADQFCGELTSDECPDTVAVAIRDAIKKATGGSHV